jgi:protoporphyrinogen oxidase
MIAIIGAGLAGLSTAYHLKNTDYAVIEKEEEAGGLCRSVKKDSFTFDYTGHFLHTRHPYTEEFAKKIFPQGFNRIHRRAFIHLQGRYIPYPFQVHTYPLPQNIRKECIMGFIEAQNQKKSSPKNFLDWINQTFGEGMAKYFFLPYNEKFWKIDLTELTHEWTSWSVPQPTMGEVLQGAAGFQYEQMGYNPSFLYPKRGGIELFTKAFLPHVSNIKLGRAVKNISLKERLLLIEGEEEIPYSTLISTCPLPQLVALIEDLPDDLKRAGERLRYVSVMNLNLGIARAKVSDCHWIYFPEKKLPFYRIGFFSNISSALAPPDTSSLYVEITHLPMKVRSAESEKEGDENELLKQSVKGLIDCGILQPTDELITAHIIHIPYAYVVYDQFRKKNLPLLIKFLRNEGIYPIGRYGSWEYSTMEEAILQGKWVAEKLQR